MRAAISLPGVIASLGVFLLCVFFGALLNLMIQLRSARKQSTLGKGGPSGQYERLPLLSALTTQEVRYEPNPGCTYPNILAVILTNHGGEDLAVWSPVWESSGDEVQAQLPFTSGLSAARLGYPRRPGELEVWEGPSDSVLVRRGESIRCSLGLLEATGEGMEPRIVKSRVGTLVLPIRTGGKLGIQRIHV